MGCDQQNLENFLSDFKWSGHSLAHVIDDSWSTASHKHERTLFEEPMERLLFYCKDIKQEIVHTLLLEEYGVMVSKKLMIIMDRRQDQMQLQLQQEKEDIRLKIVTAPEV